MNKKRYGRLLKLGLSLALLVLATFAYIKRYDLYDTWRLHSYSAPSSIAILADETKMNSYGRRLFYVNHPDVEDKSTFVVSCGTQEKTIVLGCYISGKGIYLLSVSDKRLDGVEQVTAAHEMLHAAYDRLSPGDKKKVDGWLEAACSKVTDARLKDTIEQYRLNHADIDNELHSILGTEVSGLSPDLEQYYTRYFTNRSAVVAYSNQYEAVFTESKQQIENYDKQLSALEQQYKAASADLDNQRNALIAERDQLSALLASGNRAAYNAGVAPYNAKVRAYNNAVNNSNNVVNRYKSLLAKRNEVAQETQDLLLSLDAQITSRTTLQ